MTRSRADRKAGRSSWLTAGQLSVAQLITALSSLVVNVLSARTMGPGARGSLALLLQLSYLANIASMAGIDRSYPATASVRPKPSRAAAQVLRLVLPSAVTVATVVAPVAYLLGGTGAAGAASTFGFTLTLGALVAGLVLRTAATAAGTGRVYVLATTTGQLALVVVAAIFMFGGVRSTGPWLIGYGTALLIGPLLGWRVARRSDPPVTRPEPDPRAARRLGLRLLPATLASMVMLRADRLLLPWLGSYEQLGLYIVVATMTEFVVWPVQSYVDAQIPRWHRDFLTGELRCRGALVGAAGYGLVAAVALGVAGNLLVVPVLGDAYRDSATLIAPLAVGAGLYSFGRVAVGLNVAAGRPRAVLTADLPAMAIALACYAVLIPRLGALGAALASAVSYGVGAVIAGVCCRSITGPPQSTARIEIAAAGTASLASGSAQ